MVQNFKSNDKNYLFAIPIPQITRSYKPISHENIYNQVMEQLDKSNLKTTNENFLIGRRGEQLVGYIDVAYDGNKELGMRLAYRNSYDKSMSVGFSAGSFVVVCSNGLLRGELNFIKKHTGSVVKELEARIIQSINQLEDHFRLMEKHSQKMKNIELSKTAIASLIGRMYLEEDLVTINQLSIIKNQFKKPSYDEFSDPNLWSVYNYTTESLKKSSPMNYIKSHVDLHKFVETEFSL